MEGLFEFRDPHHKFNFRSSLDKARTDSSRHIVGACHHQYALIMVDKRTTGSDPAEMPSKRQKVEKRLDDYVVGTRRVPKAEREARAALAKKAANKIKKRKLQARAMAQKAVDREKAKKQAIKQKMLADQALAKKAKDKAKKQKLQAKTKAQKVADKAKAKKLAIKAKKLAVLEAAQAERRAAREVRWQEMQVKEEARAIKQAAREAVAEAKQTVKDEKLAIKLAARDEKLAIKEAEKAERQAARETAMTLKPPKKQPGEVIPKEWEAAAAAAAAYAAATRGDGDGAIPAFSPAVPSSSSSSSSSSSDHGATAKKGKRAQKKTPAIVGEAVLVAEQIKRAELLASNEEMREKSEAQRREGERWESEMERLGLPLLLQPREWELVHRALVTLSIDAIRETSFGKQTGGAWGRGKYKERTSEEVSVPVPHLAAAAQLVHCLQPIAFEKTNSKSVVFAIQGVDDLVKFLPGFPRIVKKCNGSGQTFIPSQFVHEGDYDSPYFHYVYAFLDAEVVSAKVTLRADRVSIVFRAKPIKNEAGDHLDDHLDGLSAADWKAQFVLDPSRPQHYRRAFSTDIQGHDGYESWGPNQPQFPRGLR